MRLFRIEGFVDERRLADALWGLSGNIRDLQVRPVINGAIKGSSVVDKGAGRLVDVFRNWMIDAKLKVLTSADARRFLQATGGSQQSVSYLLREAVKAGFLKKRGKGSTSTYSVKAS